MALTDLGAFPDWREHVCASDRHDLEPQHERARKPHIRELLAQLARKRLRRSFHQATLLPFRRRRRLPGGALAPAWEARHALA